MPYSADAPRILRDPVSSPRPSSLINAVTPLLRPGLWLLAVLGVFPYGAAAQDAVIPRLELSSQASGPVTLRWQSDANSQYGIEFSPDLGPEGWQQVAARAGDGSLLAWQDDDTGRAARSTRFYRVSLLSYLMASLDADRNGLYDDLERKGLLAFFVNSPALDGPFDLDSDGRVSIEEQTEDRHPISYVLEDFVLGSGEKIPWSPNIFPEWFSLAFFQEDVPVGEVTQLVSRDKTRDQPVTAFPLTALKPNKTQEGAGVAFAGTAAQYMYLSGESQARIAYRWCLFTFRVDDDSGLSEQTVFLDVNQGTSSSKSSPKIWYDKTTGLNVQYTGQYNGALDKRIMRTTNIATDGETWNVLVCGIRYGQMFASVNGVPLSTVDPQPPRFSGDWPRNATTFIGNWTSGGCAWAMDALVLGMTEPSEATVQKMTGWAAHRLGFTHNLPLDHPYRKRHPILDAEDFPERYKHDDAVWTAWGQGIMKSVTRVNAGGPRVDHPGFERVFYDDFRRDRIQPSTSGEGDLWYGPGFNPAVGANAALVTPGRNPDTYAHDAVNQKQKLSLIKQGNTWWGSAFYSVNDIGHGYTWRGPKIFRIRCMFPEMEQSELAGGLFPAFWSYGVEQIYWRTANRIEVDWFENDGKNGKWYNGLSSHVHYPQLRQNIFAKNTGSYQRYKVYSGELTEENSGIAGGYFIWDGQYHTWEFVVDWDWTYVNLTVRDAQGAERWVEVCRVPTSPTYLEELDLQLDYALRSNDGVPANGAQQDFFVDFIEVLQRSDELEKLPAPFVSRPVISGSNSVGGVITCDPRVEGVTDLRYYWYADDYPLTYGPSSSYTLSAAEAGKAIRCMVKAVGARNRPDAWSNVLE